MKINNGSKFTIYNGSVVVETQSSAGNFTETITIDEAVSILKYNHCKLNENNIMFHIGDNNSVRVYYDTIDGTTIKTLTSGELISILQASKNNVDNKRSALEYSSNLLPHLNIHTIQTKKYKDGTEYFVLLRDADPADFEYYGNMFEKVGMPRLLFAVVVLNNIVQGFKIAAVKDRVIKADTEIYYYPFSNVSGPTSFACLGGNNISKFTIDNTSQLHTMPSVFLAMPNSNDGYSNKNESGLEYRPLLEKLSGKKFPLKFLKPARMNYEKWFDAI